MPEQYDKHSTDSVITEIHTLLKCHIEDTQRYRNAKDARDTVIESRVSSLEGDKKKLIGIAAGAGIGSGSIFAGLSKLFGGQ